MSQKQTELKAEAAKKLQEAFALLRKASAEGAPALSNAIRHIHTATTSVDRNVALEMQQELTGLSKASRSFSDRQGSRFGKKAPKYARAKEAEEVEVLEEVPEESGRFTAPEYKIGEEAKNESAPGVVDKGAQDQEDQDKEVVATEEETNGPVTTEEETNGPVATEEKGPLDGLTIKDVAESTKEELTAAFSLPQLKELAQALGLKVKNSSSKPAYAARLIEVAKK